MQTKTKPARTAPRATHCSAAVAKPVRPTMRFQATEYRVPLVGEWFWADGDSKPSVCRMYDGMDISYHNGGKRWVLVEKR